MQTPFPLVIYHAKISVNLIDNMPTGVLLWLAVVCYFKWVGKIQIKAKKYHSSRQFQRPSAFSEKNETTRIFQVELCCTIECFDFNLVIRIISVVIFANETPYAVCQATGQDELTFWRRTRSTVELKVEKEKWILPTFILIYFFCHQFCHLT